VESTSTVDVVQAVPSSVTPAAIPILAPSAAPDTTTTKVNVLVHAHPEHTSAVDTA
jgi:hypothetical protein